MSEVHTLKRVMDYLSSLNDSCLRVKDLNEDDGFLPFMFSVSVKHEGTSHSWVWPRPLKG